jgi:thiaminase/transcriptional activator TenA
MAFTDELRQAADPIWAAEHEHPFVRGIGEGSLDAAKFRHYVRQDYLFLIDYARLLALGCARAPRLDEMGRFAQLAGSVLGSEMELHRSFPEFRRIRGSTSEARRGGTTPLPDSLRSRGASGRLFGRRVFRPPRPRRPGAAHDPSVVSQC